MKEQKGKLEINNFCLGYNANITLHSKTIKDGELLFDKSRPAPLIENMMKSDMEVLIQDLQGNIKYLTTKNNFLSIKNTK